MTFRDNLRDLGMEMIEQGDLIIPHDIVREAVKRWPGEYSDDAQRLAFNAALGEAKRLLKGLQDDGGSQLRFPGFDLPTAIAIPDGAGGFVYRATAFCNRGELEAGRIVREHNVTAAQEKLDHYDEILERLAPFMEDPDVTVRDAVRMMTAEAAL